MRHVSTGGRGRVPFLHEKQIEREAQAVLDGWAAKGNAVGVPIPIDEILECHLGLTLEIVDLAARFGTQGVFGAIWFNAGIIRIDSSLDPADHPAKRGRYNFTLAHEIGHWVLHRAHLHADAEYATLFGPGAGPAFVCRAGDKRPEEWQADRFAGCLLMPRAAVFDAWNEVRPDGMEVAVGEIVGATGGQDVESAIQRFSKPMAAKFEVSAQAMGIRLRDVGLIVNEVQPRLFG